MENVYASAPGKILLAGGYLILDEKYRGLVLASPSRFHVNCKVKGTSATENCISVTFNSPQFLDGNWGFRVLWDENSNVTVKLNAGNDNQFLHWALYVCFRLAKCTQDLDVTVVSDPEFYSYRQYFEKHNMPCNLDSLRAVPYGQSLDCTIQDVHKTGLGSSAALTTAVVAAILGCLGLVSPKLSEMERSLVHGASQIAHCLAQGKIGSGFDVAAAVYGSLIYTRLPKSLQENVRDKDLKQVLENKLWSLQPKAPQLPPDVYMLLGDVNGGSSTPNMVRKIMLWRSENPVRATQIWDSLEKANESLISAFAFTDKRSFIAKAKESCKTIRAAFQQLSIEAEVPIEPVVQTELLDFTEKIQGVIGVGIPGAGGCDAVFCIVDSQEALCRVEQFWASFQKLKVCSLLTVPALSDNRIEHTGINISFQSCN